MRGPARRASGPAHAPPPAAARPGPARPGLPGARRRSAAGSETLAAVAKVSSTSVALPRAAAVGMFATDLEIPVPPARRFLGRPGILLRNI